MPYINDSSDAAVTEKGEYEQFYGRTTEDHRIFKKIWTCAPRHTHHNQHRQQRRDRKILNGKGSLGH